MNNLLEGIKSYLDMDSTGALMVSGDWGCGKTYHIDNIVIPGLKEEGYNPVKVSLFGIESVNDIPLRIAENYKVKTLSVVEEDKEEGNTKKRGWFSRNKEKATEAIARGSQALASVTWLSNFIDLKSLLSKYSDLLYKLIPTENTVIFLDDMERVIDTIDTHTLLGAINGLVEQRGYKVVVIANNDYIQQKEADRLVFKEKVIEKTLVYEPDVVAIYKEICDKDFESPYRDFMKDSRAVAIIDPAFPAYKDEEEFQTDLRNIRILKFALSHFHEIYEAFQGIFEGENKYATDSVLLSLWAVTLGLSVEYKKNRLTYKSREQYIRYLELSSVDWALYDGSDTHEGLFDETDEKTMSEQEKKEKARQLAFDCVNFVFQKIVKPHDLPFIISDKIYDFVTAGVAIDKDGIKTLWDDYKAKEQRKKQNPAYELLDRFMKGQWNMSNEQMETALVTLAQYVEAGVYRDNISYVNAATYLQHMQMLTPYSQEELKSKITAGIDKMYALITEISILESLNVEVTEDQIPDISKWVVEYEKKKMAEVKAAGMIDEIKEVCRQFNEDMDTLTERLTIQYGSTKTPDFAGYPILSHIPLDDIVKKVQTIQPKEVMCLYDIINTRFVQLVDPKVNQSELPFVNNLALAIEKRKPEKKVYSDILIEDHLKKLMKKIQGCIWYVG